MVADDDDARTSEARRLLARLTEWDREWPAVGPEITSLGEGRARITQLESELGALGARYARRGGVYVLTGWASRGNGGRDPDDGGR
jgi:hypothetical protein